MATSRSSSPSASGGSRRLPSCRVVAALALACAPAVLGASSFPQRGIHDGNNRITWPNGCCEGDLIIIDFRDEQGDGNDGQGYLKLNNSADYAESYGITCAAKTHPSAQLAAVGSTRDPSAG